MTTGRLRVAVVGTGSWAQRAHLPGWQRDGRAEVVAVADTNAAALAQAAATFGVPRAVRTTASCSRTRTSMSSTW